MYSSDQVIFYSGQVPKTPSRVCAPKTYTPGKIHIVLYMRMVEDVAFNESPWHDSDFLSMHTETCWTIP